MFFKYLFNNIRNSPHRYMLLFLCIVTVIVISVVANAIYINSTASQNNIIYLSSSYELRFDSGSVEQNAVEARDKIYEMIERSGLECYRMYLYPAAPTDMRGEKDPITNMDYKGFKYIAENYGETSFWWFASYGDMVNYLTGVWNCDRQLLPTEEQYNNDKVVVLGKPAEYPVPSDNPNKPDYVTVEHNYVDDDHVIIGGEEYLATGNTNMQWSTALFSGIPQNMLVRYVTIEFKKPLTLAQVNKVNEILKELFDGVGLDIYEPQTRDLLDMRKSTANIILTAMMAIICVFNILIIYKFMVDSRKKQFAVMRLCGFKKIRCVLYLWGEIALITTVCLPAAFGVFELVKPVLNEKYGSVPIVFTAGYYIALGAVFLAVTTVLFAVYIIPSFGKNVSRELREM